MKKDLLKRIGIIWFLLILWQVTPAIAQEVLVKGVVTSQLDGTSLPGVSVLDKGTFNGVITDIDGKFSISVSSTSTLVFSYIGFLSQEIKVGNQSEIQVVLELDTKLLDEIVVIGYGTQKKAELSSAVSSVNVESIKKLPGANVANMLQGQVAGVTSNVGSGSPGAAPVIRVRGMGTIGNNDPLYVIDGIPGSISSINPADIESIDILKDAAAATIYGSRASNGVVIITTKRGKSGPPVVSFDSYVGISNVSKQLDLATTSQNNQISTAAYAAEGLPPLAYTLLPIENNTDWQDEMFRTGIEQKYDLGVSGGNEYANYNFSLGYYNKEGNVINTDYSRFNMRMNADFNISEKVKIGQTISYARSNRNKLGENESSNNGGNAGFSPVLQILEGMPHNAVYDNSTANGFAVPIVGSGNIVGLTNLITDKSTSDVFQGNVYLEAEIVDGLKFRTQLGTNTYSSDQVYHVPTYTFGPQSANDKTSLWELRSKTFEWVWNNVLDYSKTFGEHSVSALVGISSESRETKSTGGSNNELPSNKLFSLSSGIGDANSFGGNVTRTLLSQFGQFNYAYGGKYLVQASIRRDGSSRFGEDNKYGVFPSLSLGWRLSSEDFFNVDAISNLKPRFSIGKLGNQNIDDYLFLATVSSNNNALNYPLGPDESQTVNIGTISRSLASYDIKWEESTTSNFGLDFGLLEDQIVVTFDYFNTDTKDMLVGVPVPSTSGITVTPVTNAGEMNNKGWELGLGYKKVKGDFLFSITGNISSTKNQITKLGFADESFTAGHVIYDTHPTTRTEVGRSIGEFYLFKTDGLFQNQSEIDAHGIQPNAQPGDIKFMDVDGNGELNDDDKAYVGSGLPDFEYGLTFNGSYKKIDFMLFFQGSEGNEVYNGTKVYTYRRQGDDKSFSSDLLNAWTPSNTDASVPRVSMQDANQNIRPSDYFMENGSYLRLKNVQAGYSFGQVAKVFSSARVYVAAENLLTITKYTGYDPASTGYQQFSRGVDVGLYPISRSFIMGLQLKF